MRLIKLPRCMNVVGRSEPFNTLDLDLLCGWASAKANGDLEFGEYGVDWWIAQGIVWHGKHFHYKFKPGVRPGYASFQNGTCYLEDAQGQRLEGAPEFLSLLISHAATRADSGQTNGTYQLGYLVDRESGLDGVQTIGNLETQEVNLYSDVFPKNTFFTNERMLSDRILAVTTLGGKCFCCLNFNLEMLWEFRGQNFRFFDSRRASLPEAYQDVAIFLFGPTSATRSPGEVHNGEQYADKVLKNDGLVFGLDLDDGHERWRRVLPRTVENLALVEDKLYLCSVNEIHVLDPLTGDTLQVVKTGLSDDYDCNLYKNFVSIAGDFVFFAHQADCVLLVYSLSDLELLARIDIPEGHTLDNFQCLHAATGKAYFILKAFGWPDYHHLGSVFEVDTNNLDAPLEIVSGPAVEIELKPSQHNTDAVDVWIGMHDVPLNEAMIYAEMHCEDQAFYHGSNGSWASSGHVTKNFTGVVHFRYSGSDQPAAKVQEKLDLLSKRFADWARTYASSPDGGPVRLDAQYVA